MTIKNLGEAMEAVSDLTTQALGFRGILDLYNLSKTDYVNEDGTGVYDTALQAALSDMEETIAELKKLVTTEE